MEGLNWRNCLLILTWQKIAPIILLINNLNITFILSIIIIFSSLIGGITGLNQINLRKILAYSSINHIGWIIARILNSLLIWFIYFLIYTIITINIIIILKYFNIFYLKQLFIFINSNKILQLFFLINFFSLGGLPPFLGFFPKWLTINNLIQNYFILIRLFLILSTLITLYFYIRITFSSLILYKNENLLYNKKYNYYFIFLFNLISLIGLIICIITFSFF